MLGGCSRVDRDFPLYGVPLGADRFLITFDNPDAPTDGIHVVLNFFEVLRERIPN